MDDLLSSYSDVLSDVQGHTHVLEHEIRTATYKLNRVSQRQIPFALAETMKDKVNNMLEFGIIDHLNSPYSSQIVLVSKKDTIIGFVLTLEP